MKPLRFLTVVVLAGCLLSCEDTNRTDDDTDMFVSADLQKYMETVSLDSINQAICRSLATEEQFQIFYKLNTVFLPSIEFKDNVFTCMPEEEFLSKGFPKSYYNTIMRGVRSWNYYAQMNVINDDGGKVADIVYRQIRNFQQQIEEGTYEKNRRILQFEKRNKR
jgi:hypothetical protein